MKRGRKYEAPRVTVHAARREVSAAWQTLVSASRQILAAEASGDPVAIGEAAKALRCAAWNYTDVSDATMAAFTAPGYARRWVRS